MSNDTKKLSPTGRVPVDPVLQKITSSALDPEIGSLLAQYRGARLTCLKIDFSDLELRAIAHYTESEP